MAFIRNFRVRELTGPQLDQLLTEVTDLAAEVRLELARRATLTSMAPPRQMAMRRDDDYGPSAG